jgi:hypothetical protein
MGHTGGPSRPSSGESWPPSASRSGTDITTRRWASTSPGASWRRPTPASGRRSAGAGPAAAPAHRLGRNRHLPRQLDAGRVLPGADRRLRRRLLEGIAQTRECYMPRAGFGSRVPLRIEETGYGTGPGRSEADQATATAEFARAPTATAVPTTSATSASSAYATTTAPGRAFSSTSASCATTTARSPPSTSFAARSAATGRARAGPAEVGGAAAP